MRMRKEKPNVIKANYRLQQKVGSGPIDENAVKHSQTVIETNQVDFMPVGMAILQKLEHGLRDASNPSVTLQELKETLTTPIMELKANATIFHYTLVGNLANIMLNFLENIQIIDRDAIEIVKAHHSSMFTILSQKISGDGGVAGKALIQELQQACDRYYNKKVAK